MVSSLRYGDSLTFYINKDISFLLRDIINWCNCNTSSSMSEKLLAYIADNELKDLDKEYFVVSNSYRTFASKGALDEYEKYFGYSLKEVNKDGK